MSAPSPGSSCNQPMKNLASVFCDEIVAYDLSIGSSERQRSESPEPSCVSVKSNASMMEPLKFSDGPGTSNPPGEIYDLNKSLPYSASHYQHHIRMNTSVSYLLTHKKTIHKTHGLLEETEALIQDSHQSVDDVLQRFKDQHKTSMKNKYERLSEGNKQENVTLLNRIYTQLYIIEGESEGVNEEHEVLQMEKTARTQHSQDTSIYCSDIFKASPEPGCEEKDQIKTVLTKGIAGIGKTVSVQKSILVWHH
ncbi:uncharacterized protein LOC107711132 [Sinocyclocheilus rhinocerous]|uniref:uncharacterized protein LOC107711132 n=1 Tax=Sinocyclocheilus rhinocerous TaxID=307959 RepID=UPI0007B8CE36|nr:PREDICTED: uncharacterized protein LOC107711132 [Sinocyclocheilus rhinocerous]